MTFELIENQRWYTLIGWSGRLNAEDPPSWHNSKREEMKNKDHYKEYVWEFYKGEEYDEEGWIYGTNFENLNEFGRKNVRSCVRKRIWMGKLQSQLKEEQERAAKTAEIAQKIMENEMNQTKGQEALLASLHKTTTAAAAVVDSPLFPTASTIQVTKTTTTELHGVNTGENAGDELFPTSNEASELFPTAVKETTVSVKTTSTTTVKASNSSRQEETTTKSSFFGRISAAALSLPTSAVMGAVQSVKEVSLYAYENAQVAAISAISAEPVISPDRLKMTSKDVREINSMLSKKFPDLTPIDRSLVTCCEGDILKFMAPPEATITKSCKACGIDFGTTKFRYKCGYCSESFCLEDLPFKVVLRAFGHTTPSRICAQCNSIVIQKVDQQLIQWREQRIDDYLDDRLIPYYNTATDTAVDKIMRAAEGTLAAAKAAPIGATAKMAVVSADFLRKYGRAGLLGFILRNEFMQSFATLRGLIGDLDELGMQDAALGIYYFMAMNRGERGENPDNEMEMHKECEKISDSLLNEMLLYAPLALHAIYQNDVLDMQRISKHQDFSLIYAHVQDQDVRHPSFALLASKNKKIALLLIRGSKSVQDLLTDIQAHPEEITDLKKPSRKNSGANSNETAGSESGGSNSGSNGTNGNGGGFVDAFAHNGMLKAATWIKDRIFSSLQKLHLQGYEIVLSGHSLGGGCAALISIMLHKEFPNLKCYGYAVPACVNLHVAESCVNYVHSVVLRDDFVPRAKASNIQKLCQELKEFRTIWKSVLNEDLEAVKERAKTIWAPRKREWAIEQADKKKGKLRAITPADESNTTSPSKSGENKSEAVAKETEEKGTQPSFSTENTEVTTGNETEAAMEEEKQCVSSWTLTRGNLIEKMDNVAQEEEGKKEEEKTSKEEDKPKKEENISIQELQVDPKKELYIPGTISHLYFYRGVYEAVHVSRSCYALSHIPVFQNMLSDHHGKNYLDALKIVRDYRRMKPDLPEWVPFGTKTRCMICDSPFTWNSTSTSEAQQNLDQHNCRRCGCLVCGGCSEKFKSIPEFGINSAVRVCDRCFYAL